MTIPPQVKQFPGIYFFASLLRRIKYIGWRRYCTVCRKHFRIFKPYGIVSRNDAACPNCGSLERHRLLVIYLHRRTNLFDGRPRRVLHVAPERGLAKILRQAAGGGYHSADLSGVDVMEKMDISSICHPDATFDVVICNHVLEHVSEDRKAMREIFRVLKLGGWAILNVPVSVDETFENPLVTEPPERLRLFGQEDHVRRYGPDFQDRLQEAGFEVNSVSQRDFLTSEQIARWGLANGGAGNIFYCAKVHAVNSGLQLDNRSFPEI